MLCNAGSALAPLRGTVGAGRRRGRRGGPQEPSSGSQAAWGGWRGRRGGVVGWTRRSRRVGVVVWARRSRRVGVVGWTRRSRRVGVVGWTRRSRRVGFDGRTRGPSGDRRVCRTLIGSGCTPRLLWVAPLGAPKCVSPLGEVDGPSWFEGTSTPNEPADWACPCVPASTPPQRGGSVIGAPKGATQSRYCVGVKSKETSFRRRVGHCSGRRRPGEAACASLQLFSLYRFYPCP